MVSRESCIFLDMGSIHLGFETSQLFGTVVARRRPEGGPSQTPVADPADQHFGNWDFCSGHLTPDWLLVHYGMAGWKVRQVLDADRDFRVLQQTAWCSQWTGDGDWRHRL